MNLFSRVLKSVASVSLLALFVFLSACGGGEDTGSSNVSTSEAATSTEAITPGASVNNAPTISGTPATSVDENKFFSFQPIAGDSDGDNLTFNIQNRPVWASFNAGTGRLSGTPTSADVGSYNNIVISVSDGTETVLLPAFNLSVNSIAVKTGSAVLSWNAPVSRSDGNALAMSEIANYTIYYGTVPGNYGKSVAVNDAYATSMTISGLPVGTYSFVMTTTDVNGRESSYSNVATKAVP